MDMETKVLGRYIIAAPDICHGQPTFRGTRILVSAVLEQVANGMAWEAIIEEWRGSLKKEAITDPKANGNCCGAGVFMPQVKMK
jgi:uncharacterized protein (DUF433 family)